MESAPPNKLIPLLLFGLRDPNSHLHKFTRDIDAFRLLITVISRRNFRAWIDRSTKVRSRIRGEFDKGMICFPEEIAFPEPLRNEDGTAQEFHVNMMPFVMVNPDVGLDDSVLYEKHMYTHHKLEEMLPPECKRYAPIIAELSLPHALPFRSHQSTLNQIEEWGKVGYLTIHESYVQEGATQRRPGLHIESPGNLPDDPFIEAHAYHRFYCWGGGNFGTGIDGHLDQFGKVNVMICRVWDCMISEHWDVTFALGNIEHMRGVIGEGVNMKANQLFWITDRTPHESLKQSKPGFRQFFRLVTSELSAWYQQHNTENSVGTKPTCDIIYENKFA
ncbi:hypothetical protein HDU79_003460 [Rhizoclosmatium sp. JEL0117]|nr:hypothetical protein HDU79_003460 [Rhizoclosmatium sp. JEL0117]